MYSVSSRKLSPRDEHPNHCDLIDALIFQPLDGRAKCGRSGHAEGDLDRIGIAQQGDDGLDGPVPGFVAAVRHDQDATLACGGGGERRRGWARQTPGTRP